MGPTPKLCRIHCVSLHNLHPFQHCIAFHHFFSIYHLPSKALLPHQKPIFSFSQTSMALSRRPARFHARHSMPSPSHHTLHLLRAAAARVYINNDEKPSRHHSEQEDPEHGVKLLAAAAAEMAKEHQK